MYRISVDDNVRCVVEDINTSGRRAVLFVHGWPLSRQIFESQFAVLPSYGIRCISYDIRGFGESDKPWKSYTYDRLADDLCNLIKTIDCQSVTLCGFSMGGAVCVRYMARHRGFKVNRLVLMGAACPSFVQRPGFPCGMTREQVDLLIAQAYADRPQLCENFARMCFSSPISNASFTRFSQLAWPASGGATIQTLESLRDEDLREDMGRVRVPTAIFHGIHDQVCPYPLAEEMHRGIPDSFVIPFENSGHCLFMEEKDKCNASLIDFVNART